MRMTSPKCSLTIIGLLLVACKEGPPQTTPPPPEVDVTRVVIQDVPVYLEAVGETAGFLDIPVRARVDGVIEEMHFEEGNVVEKGAMLYTIDPKPFEAKVREAQGRLAEAKAKLVRAEANLKRVEPLVKIDALSKRTLDDAIAERDASQGVVDASEATVTSAKIDLGYVEIRSPIDGLIGVSEAYVSDYVGRYPNPIVLNTVSQLDPIKVRFAITERDYLMLMAKRSERMAAGEEPKAKKLELFLADGSLYPEIGEFAFAGREMDAKTGTLMIEATFPNPDAETGIRPGQFARIRVTVDVRKDATLVPQKAVRELQGTYQIYVVTSDNKIESRNVKVGVRVGSLWLIEEGIKAGDQVVVSGLHRVRPGAEVRPKLVEPQKESEQGATGK